eukprot:6269001-Amphidinium_carterae.1
MVMIARLKPRGGYAAKVTLLTVPDVSMGSIAITIMRAGTKMVFSVAFLSPRTCCILIRPRALALRHWDFSPCPSKGSGAGRES